MRSRNLTRDGGPLLLVDGVTAVGVLSVPMDEWGIDALVTGSQKALMLPPGLAFIGLSDRAWERARETASPRFYFDLESERKGQAKGSTAYTPAVSLVFGLCAALKLMREEGLERVYARHDRMARATRAAVTAMGLKLLSPDNPSPAATGLYVPEGADGDALLDYLRAHMGVTLAEGQDHLSGQGHPHRPRGPHGRLRRDRGRQRAGDGVPEVRAAGDARPGCGRGPGDSAGGAGLKGGRCPHPNPLPEGEGVGGTVPTLERGPDGAAGG